MTASEMRQFVRARANMRWSEDRGVRGSIGVLACAAMTALGAGVRIPLPWTPVPITLQTFFVLLAGAALGPALGAASQALYLSALAGGAGGGSPLLASPTTGYILGFPLAATATGWLMRRQADIGILRIVGCMAVGTMTIYACGAAWLMGNLSWSLRDALMLGVAPFIPGDAVKLFAAAFLARAALRGDQRSRP